MHIDSLNYSRDLFIFREDVTTEFGTLRFLTYKEYLLNLNEVSVIGQNVLHIYYHFVKELKKMNASKDELDNLETLKEQKLIDIVLSIPQLLNAYLKIFQLVFDKNETEVDVKKIFSSSDSFMFLRQLIMDMNLITEERVSPNEIIQKAFERSKRVKEQGSPKQSFVDIVTSIVANTSHTYEEVGEMTSFQVYSLYARIASIFNHKATTLFATVAEKVEIESWNKHIDLFEQEKDTMTRDQFDKKFGSMLNG